MHHNVTYIVGVANLVDAENQGLPVVGKEVDKYGVKFICSDVVIFHIVVSYCSRNHICNAVKFFIEWLHTAIRSKGTELVLVTTEHVVLVEVKYRYNDIPSARNNIVAITKPPKHLY